MELLRHTVGQVLARATERFGALEALVSCEEGTRLTFEELYDEARQLAAGLGALGIEPGDRVGIWSPNHSVWIITQFAAALGGFIFVTINPAYRLKELEYALRLSEVRALLAVSSFKGSSYLDMVEAIAPEIGNQPIGRIESARLPDLALVVDLDATGRPGWRTLDEVRAAGGDDKVGRLLHAAAGMTSADAANIQFTSGTTGNPKAVTLSHENIVNNAYFVGRAIGFAKGHRLCLPVPLYHCFGMVMGVLSAALHGVTTVLTGPSFDAQAVLAAVQAERCTHLYGVPTMFIAELNHPDFEQTDFSNMIGGCMAGSPCPPEIMDQVIKRMGMRDVTIAYGMTETSPVSFQTSPNDSFSARIGTVGRIHPHVECKIIDGDGQTLGRNEAGEICTRGYSVMLGYWRDYESTRRVLDEDGWMHTGDLGVIDDDGYCRIVGRIKDLIIRGGENIAPREIEEYLLSHPDIQDVAVVGIPHPKLGEEVCAWIVPKTARGITADDVDAFCKGNIAHFKIPSVVRIVDALPLTVTGKVQKFLIRNAMKANTQDSDA